MGRVPIPVCPMKETAKLPSRADFSEARHPLTLSRPIPPYSSGISMPRRPSAPAFFMSSRVTSYLRARISGIRGAISFSMKSAVVSAIMRCSSDRSSTVKTSPGARSSMRKLPPRAATTGVLVSVAIGMSPRTASREALEDAGRAHAAAHAHGDEPVAAIAAAKLGEDLGRELGAGAAERVPESDRAAVHVHPLRIEAQRLDDGEGLGGEGLVQLDEVDLGEGETGLLQGPGDGLDGAD